MRIIPTAVACAAALLTVFEQAEASVITEMEPNNSIASAQDINSFFSLDFDADIGDVNGINTSETIPHVTVMGTGDGTFDYYSFFVPTAGAVGIFDIDDGIGAGNVDTELGLFDSDGTLLASNDNFDPASAGAGGSASSLDAFIQYTFASSGTYVIGVGEHESFQNDGGFSGNVLDANDAYRLQVSIAIPEPASIIAFAGLALCLGAAAWWRQAQAARR